ncbi:DUF3035 domain-containing protein [Candidatus Pelagibacter bacterium nBUS_33]|uniref:DUF3035 domain-containing protein n=1 Tax=Candidatus Pelagibacter bacterium nBUS_33 TaxID=3374193 RepID=UPI003EBFFE26
MKLFKFYIAISIAIILSSCGTIKDGFSNQKKNNSDEFLVEKKSPLVMPPDYNELPIPNDEKTEKETKDIKSLISKSKQEEISEDLNKKNSSIEGSILKKIKKN